MTKLKIFWVKTEISIDFQKNYSTNTFLTHLINKISTGFEKGPFTGMILNYLLKTFDTIHHQILIKKMKYLHYLKKIIETKSIPRKPSR